MKKGFLLIISFLFLFNGGMRKKELSDFVHGQVDRFFNELADEIDEIDEQQSIEAELVITGDNGRKLQSVMEKLVTEEAISSILVSGTAAPEPKTCSRDLDEFYLTIKKIETFNLAFKINRSALLNKDIDTTEEVNLLSMGVQIRSEELKEEIEGSLKKIENCTSSISRLFLEVIFHEGSFSSLKEKTCCGEGSFSRSESLKKGRVSLRKSLIIFFILRFNFYIEKEGIKLPESDDQLKEIVKKWLKTQLLSLQLNFITSRESTRNVYQLNIYYKTPDKTPDKTLDKKRSQTEIKLEKSKSQMKGTSELSNRNEEVVTEKVVTEKVDWDQMQGDQPINLEGEVITEKTEAAKKIKSQVIKVKRDKVEGVKKVIEDLIPGTEVIKDKVDVSLEKGLSIDAIKYFGEKLGKDQVKGSQESGIQEEDSSDLERLGEIHSIFSGYRILRIKLSIIGQDKEESEQINLMKTYLMKHLANYWKNHPIKMDSEFPIEKYLYKALEERRSLTQAAIDRRRAEYEIEYSESFTDDRLIPEAQGPHDMDTDYYIDQKKGFDYRLDTILKGRGDYYYLIFLIEGNSPYQSIYQKILKPLSDIGPLYRKHESGWLYEIIGLKNITEITDHTVYIKLYNKLDYKFEIFYPYGNKINPDESDEVKPGMRVFPGFSFYAFLSEFFYKNQILPLEGFVFKGTQLAKVWKENFDLEFYIQKIKALTIEEYEGEYYIKVKLCPTYCYIES